MLLETEFPGGPVSRDSLPTPALVIDAAILERNIATMADFAARSRVALRPHAKSHKCLAIARRQIASGAIGISCATLDELAAMVTGRVPGLLLTTPLAGRSKLAQLGQLLRQDPSIKVVADDPAGVSELATLSAEVGTRIQVLVDVDVGQRRTGCRTAIAALSLAKQISGIAGLEFVGLQAYAGHIQHLAARDARLTAATAIADQIRSLCASLRRARLEPRVVTGSGTGTTQMDATLGAFTELQAGSYVFMDVDYLSIEGAGVDCRPSLFVDTTVVSALWEDHVTTDAGTKAFALNGPPPVPAAGVRGWMYSYEGDEFGRITLGPGSRRPTRGERLALVVSHCDPTVVLYPRYAVVRGNRVEEYWPIAARHSPMISP